MIDLEAVSAEPYSIRPVIDKRQNGTARTDRDILRFAAAWCIPPRPIALFRYGITADWQIGDRSFSVSVNGNGQIDALSVFICALDMEQEGLVFIDCIPTALLNGESGKRWVVDENDRVLRRIRGQVLRNTELPGCVVCNRHILLSYGGILSGFRYRLYQIVAVCVLIVDRVRNRGRFGVIEDDLLIKLIDDDARAGVGGIVLFLLIRR